MVKRQRQRRHKQRKLMRKIGGNKEKGELGGGTPTKWAFSGDLEGTIGDDGDAALHFV